MKQKSYTLLRSKKVHATSQVTLVKHERKILIKVVNVAITSKDKF